MSTSHTFVIQLFVDSRNVYRFYFLKIVCVMRSCEHLSSYLFCYFDCVLWVATGDCYVTSTTDRNRTVLAGSSVSFECTTNVSAENNESKTIRWNFHPSSSKNPIRVYNGVKVISARYALTSNPWTGQSQLVVRQAERDDGGQYECREMHSAFNTLTFELHVIGKLDLVSFVMLTILRKHCFNTATLCDGWWPSCQRSALVI